MSDRWEVMNPSQSTEVATSFRSLFHEVYRRAKRWRPDNPKAPLREQRAALEGILIGVEMDLGAASRERPGLLIEVLLTDLRKTLWRGKQLAAPLPRWNQRKRLPS